MRTIKKIHKPVYEPISDLETYRVIPTQSIEYLDPFLFLNHHGPQVYQSNNNGLPFGPHPHRGMETVTFILEGDIAHFDSSGEASVIKAGGVQWMTAGSGLIHSEVSSDEFKKEGGLLEILQLWINLPAKNKMSKPFYKGLQNDKIPHVKSDDGLSTINVISGDYKDLKGPFDSGIGVKLVTVSFQKGAKLDYEIPKQENIFFYLIKGHLEVNNQIVNQMSLVEFNHDHELIHVNSHEESILLLGTALPLNEPVISQGPFVMNSQEEIWQAYEDYRNGKFGSWNH